MAILKKLKKIMKKLSRDNRHYSSDPYGSDDLDDPNWDGEDY